MNKNYSIPLTEIHQQHVVMNSRFIATLAPAFTLEEARAFIKRIKEQFADATHNVPAYIIGGGNAITEFCSDDGEPPGTAGRPALAVLRGSGLGDVVLVVTRYFGGTLLGTGGLVRAYTESAQMVVAAVGRGRRVPVHVVMLAIPYHLLERVRALTTPLHGEIVGEDYATDITITMRIPIESFETFQEELRELSAGKIKAEIIETTESVVAL